uniref:Uncharacterized protein n=1 Tax=Rhizophora mucronata TaxID=61149 RepID=A0A2P2QIX0_RHIMU
MILSGTLSFGFIATKIVPFQMQKTVQKQLQLYCITVNS